MEATATTTETHCHCGAPFHDCDHCHCCGCEQFECYCAHRCPDPSAPVMDHYDADHWEVPAA